MGPGARFLWGLSHPLRDDGGEGELQKVRQEVGDHAQEQGAEDADGLAALEIDAEVASLSAAGRYVAVLTGEELVIYDKQLKPCAQLQEVSQAREVLMRSDGSAVLAGSMAASLYLP